MHFIDCKLCCQKSECLKDDGDFKMKRVLEMDSDDGCTTVWMYLILLNCILENAEHGKSCILPQFKKIKLKVMEEMCGWICNLPQRPEDMQENEPEEHAGTVAAILMCLLEVRMTWLLSSSVKLLISEFSWTPWCFLYLKYSWTPGLKPIVNWMTFLKFLKCHSFTWTYFLKVTLEKERLCSLFRGLGQLIEGGSF